MLSLRHQHFPLPQHRHVARKPPERAAQQPGRARADRQQRRWGWKVALASAVIGTAAAPMLFELPFDLIVMARTNPPLPTHPMLYPQLFFLPLFLVELSTLSLLTLLPSVRVTARACYAVAGMFVVFAVWAAFGFAFPAEPLPLALNVMSKILCFVAAIMPFAWRAE